MERSADLQIANSHISLAADTSKEAVAPVPLAGAFSQHIQILDALRGIAIILVLLFHFCEGLNHVTQVEQMFYGLFRVGWMGVDLFFVLSGFLITGILVDTKDQPRQMFNFYMRRALRIFPMYFGFLIVVFILLPFAEPALSAHHLTGAKHTFGGLLSAETYHNQAWFWTYTSNFLEILNPNGVVPYGHFWSLAIEEQFYLVWPMLLTRLTLPRALTFCQYSFLFALVLRIALVSSGAGHAANLLMPCRMDSLAAGAYVAVAWRLGRIDEIFLKRCKWIVICVLPVLLLTFVVQGFHLDATDVAIRSVGYSAIAAMFASILALCVMGGQLGWLNSSIARRFGKYSYSIYILHRPLHPLLYSLLSLSALTISWHSPMLRLLPFLFLAPVACLGVGKVSWELYESHFLALRRFFKSEASLPV